jgi:mono/diheme cytochrome c family protein
MNPSHFTSLLVLLTAVTVVAKPLSYETTPLGAPEAPLIIRTYCPDPGLDPTIFAHHGQGANSPKYNPKEGRDVPGEYKPIKGLPAAIAVNHGPGLSYVFDTTECRLLYVWQGGFLDLFPYWGSAKQGNRRSYDYVPRLVGTVIFQASGTHPQGAGQPKFIGYELDEKGAPTFQYKLGERTINETIWPSPQTFSFNHNINGTTELVTGKELSKHAGFERNLKIKVASAAAGEDVFNAYGCIACHTTDGSLGHGPTFFGLAGSPRPLADGSETKADDAYLRRAIKMPNADIVKGFPPNYMPPIPLKDVELDALILFIQSLTGE